MAKKNEPEAKVVDIPVTAGGRRICPDCKLQFRLKELFDQHRAAGCKPATAAGPTWSTIDPESVGAPVEEAQQNDN